MLAANLCHSQPVDVYVDPVSLIIPIICVSVKRLFRIRLLLQGLGRLYIKVRAFPGGLPNPKPTTINKPDSRHERGTTGGRVTSHD